MPGWSWSVGHSGGYPPTPPGTARSSKGPPRIDLHSRDPILTLASLVFVLVIFPPGLSVLAPPPPAKKGLAPSRECLALKKR
jgi:hypothetical protein